MPYLIDTNVVSELRKKGKCHPAVRQWQDGVIEGEVFISAISLMEIKNGMLGARRKDPVFGKILEDWYENQVKPTFKDRVLPVDLAVAECAGEILHHRTSRLGGLADALIAATAQVHGLTLVTRNTADFYDAGIKLVNPWDAA